MTTLSHLMTGQSLEPRLTRWEGVDGLRPSNCEWEKNQVVWYRVRKMLLHGLCGVVTAPLRGKAAYVDRRHFPRGHISTMYRRRKQTSVVVWGEEDVYQICLASRYLNWRQGIRKIHQRAFSRLLRRVQWDYSDCEQRIWNKLPAHGNTYTERNRYAYSFRQSWGAW